MDEMEIDKGTGEVKEEQGSLAVVTRVEYDRNIATAKRYPRSLKTFRDVAQGRATSSEATADECLYAIPRDGKMIEGPSIRFAEIITGAWGNCQVGARVIAEEGDHIVAQGVFFDLEANVKIIKEVKRRITNKHGKRYSPDMIATTANAACSIAQRNAIISGIPKALWSDIFDEVRKVAMGSAQTLASRRAAAIQHLGKLGVSEERICARVGVPSVDDIGLEALATLKGIAQAIKDGEITAESAFSDGTVQAPQSTVQSVAAALDDVSDPPPGRGAKIDKLAVDQARTPGSDMKRAPESTTGKLLPAGAEIRDLLTSVGFVSVGDMDAWLHDRFDTILGDVTAKKAPAIKELVSKVFGGKV